MKKTNPKTRLIFAGIGALAMFIGLIFYKISVGWAFVGGTAFFWMIMAVTSPELGKWSYKKK